MPPVCCLGTRPAPLPTLQIEQLNRYQFLTAKPMVYLANLSSADYIRKKNKWLGPIAEWVQPPPSPPLPRSYCLCCCLHCSLHCCMCCCLHCCCRALLLVLIHSSSLRMGFAPKTNDWAVALGYCCGCTYLIWLLCSVVLLLVVHSFVTAKGSGDIVIPISCEFEQQVGVTAYGYCFSPSCYPYVHVCMYVSAVGRGSGM